MNDTPRKQAAPVNKRPRRKWVRRLALLVASLAATTLLVEAGLLLLDDYPPLPRAYPGELANRTHANFEFDAQLGWRSRAGMDKLIDGEGGRLRYLADEHGRRTGPDRPDAAACERTIVLAGDSFLWGVGVVYEHSLAGRLERHFDATRVENLAQPGFALDQAVLSIELQGLALAPDLVVLGIYPPDFTRSLTAYRQDFGFNKPTFALRSGELVRLTPADAPPAWMRFVEDRSRLLGMWRRAQRRVGFEHGVGSWWRLNAALLDRLRAATRAAGIRLLIVHVPFADWRPFPALKAYCREHGVALIDPTEHDQQRPADIVFPPGGHFTAKGHAYLFDLVVDWIAHEGPAGLR